MKKFIIIDGHNLLFRAFYGISPLNDKNGNPTNALFGVSSMLFNILQNEKPHYIAFTFDIGKSFRHDIHEEYKGTRKECPEDLRKQIPHIYKMVEAMGIPIYHEEGYEADDMIATLAKQTFEKSDDTQVIIVSGDNDLFQLTNHRVQVAVPQRGSLPPKHYGPKEVEEKYGVTPKQIPEFKGIAGDSSDNIKGVPGLGPKAATKLLQGYTNLEGIYDNIHELKGAIKNKLEEHKESAFHSRHLATTVDNIPIEFSLEDVIFQGIHSDVIHFFHNFDLFTLERRAQLFLKDTPNDLIEDAVNTFHEQKTREDNNEQLSLF